MIEFFRLAAIALSGLVLLTAGAEVLVRGASRTALAWGVRPIVIGLTIVTFATSLPEFFVSVVAMTMGEHDIAAANVVGSNIFNAGFILGLAALIHPLTVERDTVRRELPFVVMAGIMLYGFAKDGVVSRWEGSLLLAVFVVFLAVCFIPVMRKTDAPFPSALEDEGPMTDLFLRKKTRRKFSGNIYLIAAGALLLIVGSKLFTVGGAEIARFFGISELAIGLTMIAIGTSLPELVTSLMASFRHEDDVSVGNVTGGNIFNALFIIGICALIQPLAIHPALIQRDMVVMIAISLLLIVAMRSGFVISRIEGALLVASYLAYFFILNLF